MHWLVAMDAEWKSLQKHATWEAMPLPSSRRAIGVRWVFKVKRLPDGRLDKYKARLVAEGYKQVQGLDYDLLFAPVAKRTSLLYFLHFVASNDLECYALDFDTAFLNGDLEEEVYIEQPERFDDGSGNVQKALYGLKQALGMRDVSFSTEDMSLTRLQKRFVHAGEVRQKALVAGLE
jgi:hypothetical protein